MKKISIDALRRYVADRFLNVETHPSGELLIWNYTEKCQYDAHWDEYTKICRGLITDLEGNIVARPFDKFFNVEELPEGELPSLPYTVHDKMDGSLGILYFHGDTPFIATRGRFASDQAVFATKTLHDRYSHLFPKLSKSCTYLFEIVYPKNRALINYGSTEDIFLLAVIDTHTRQEFDIEIGFPTPHRYPDNCDYKALKEANDRNKEGVVIRFSNGLRVKSKNAFYIENHKKTKSFSKMKLLDMLSLGNDLSDYLEGVPDEFFAEVKQLQARFMLQFEDLKALVQELVAKALLYNEGKDRAEIIENLPYPHIVFYALKHENYDSLIWKELKKIVKNETTR